MNHLPKLPKVIELIRPDDLLNLRIETDNLRLERDLPLPGLSAPITADDAPLFLVIDDPTRPALLRVFFPPQHIAEFALFEFDAEQKIKTNTDGSDAGAKKIHEDREQAKKTTADADENQLLGTIAPSQLPSAGTAPFKARMAAASRLVFHVLPGKRIPFTVEGLLDWRALKPVLHTIAALGEDPSEEQRASAPPISVPNTDQTALELPYRLLISPDQTANWTHRNQPFGMRGRYELWHTRLVTTQGDNFSELDPEHPAAMRALWSPDYKPNLKSADRNREGTSTIGNGKEGRSALSDDDRHQLVVLSSEFHGYETDLRLPRFNIFPSSQIDVNATPKFITFGSTPYIPKPFLASQVMLSPLGGWLKSRGEWIPPRKVASVKPKKILDVATSTGLRELFTPLVRADRKPGRLQNFVDLPDFAFVPNSVKTNGEQLDLSEWVHVATQGRDHYVRVVYEGELWPFYHKAALVKITERKFVQGTIQVLA